MLLRVGKGDFFAARKPIDPLRLTDYLSVPARYKFVDSLYFCVKFGAAPYMYIITMRHDSSRLLCT